MRRMHEQNNKRKKMDGWKDGRDDWIELNEKNKYREYFLKMKETGRRLNSSGADNSKRRRNIKVEVVWN